MSYLKIRWWFIAHTTTSISFSIIFNKPIIFIVNDEMLRVDSNKIQKISSFTKELSSQIFNIDENNYIDEINQQVKVLIKKNMIIITKIILAIK